VHSSLFRRFAPLVLLVALLATACGSTTSNAATANGHDISASSITDELKIIKCNPAYQQALEQSYGGKLDGASEGTFNNDFVSQLLSVRVYYQLLEDRLATDHVAITRDDETKASATTDQQLSSLGKDGSKCIDTAYKAKLVHQEALIEVASTQAGKAGAAGVQVACVSHILVKTKAEADALKKQLDGGADFATLAKASSIDDGSKPAGGDLGCKPKDTYVPEFEQAAWSIPIGKVSDPVQTQFGFHLILVRARRAALPEDAAGDSSQQALNTYLLDVVCGKTAKVSINPTYGTWDTSPCKDSAGLAKVTPPAKPETK
jgi:hypothetical protein